MVWIKRLINEVQDWNMIDWKTTASCLTEQLHNDYRVHCSQKKVSFKRSIKEGVVLSALGDAIHSGTTFSMAIVFPVFTMNHDVVLEKFRVVTIQVGDTDISINGVVTDCDHSPLNPEEFKRIQCLDASRRGKLVYETRGIRPEIFLPDGTFDPVYGNGIEFDWTKGINPSCAKYIPGSYLTSPFGYPYNTIIAMTRSIGDFYAHPLGLCTEPNVIVQDMDKIPTIFMATDGAWDACDKNNQWTPDCTLESINRSAHDATYYCETTRKVAVTLFGNGIDDVSVALLRA
jgi:hypothetical protein